MAEINIKVQIANRTYPLEIDSSEEEKVMGAAKMINDNINKLKGNYVVTDYVDLLAMSALEMALDSEPKVVKVSNDKDLGKELEEIGSMIDSCLEAG
ncbi:MAG: cell division protein ZapA [Crocinitomicaceae bacterium]|nr:cell division protein ZapA [Crocinitomicaceae bacterium]|tara:strand:+ start:11864 stop:12154 length:291 start_codon:yes stop_codon:yes gene_type:complete